MYEAGPEEQIQSVRTQYILFGNWVGEDMRWLSQVTVSFCTFPSYDGRVEENDKDTNKEKDADVIYTW